MENSLTVKQVSSMLFCAAVQVNERTVFFLLSSLEWKLRARNMNDNWTLVFVNTECARLALWIGNYALFTNCLETFIRN